MLCRSTDVSWMPLGFGMNVLNNPSFMTQASSRPLLFSWSGSTAGKEDRSQMIRALRWAIGANHQRIMRTRGKLAASGFPLLAQHSFLTRSDSNADWPCCNVCYASVWLCMPIDISVACEQRTSLQGVSVAGGSLELAAGRLRMCWRGDT